MSRLFINLNKHIVILCENERLANLVNYPFLGVHGLDPYKFRSMNPFFLAMGPAFKKNFTIETFNSVDIYPLMCHILGVEPAPNNGSMDKVKTLLWMEEGSKEDSFTITSISCKTIILSVTCHKLFSVNHFLMLLEIYLL